MIIFNFININNNYIILGILQLKKYNLVIDQTRKRELGFKRSNDVINILSK